jgi:CRP-like cAMP-binding protein
MREASRRSFFRLRFAGLRASAASPMSTRWPKPFSSSDARVGGACFITSLPADEPCARGGRVVSMIGNEGMTGLPVVLGVDRMPYRVTTQLTADALKLRTATLAIEFQRGAHMHNLLLQYLYTVLRQITQSALCHRFHTTEERLCRWLLTVSGRAKSETFHLTQESIAHMLGVPRTSVTMIADRLQQLNLIRLTRGRISIVDRQRLGHAACECYHIVASEVNHFLAS